MKIYVYTEAYAITFIVALLIITKNLAQPKCPSMYECINKLWYVHTMEHYSAMKRNKLLLYNNMVESQEHYAKRKKSQRLHTL